MPILRVRNWEKFQHYHDRRPPWIKLYVHLLDDLDFDRLSEAAQNALFRIWMLAARVGHPLPHDPKLLREKGGIRPKALQELLDGGWVTSIEVADSASTDASKVASGDASNGASTDASSRARPRARERESTETEREPTPAAAAARARWESAFDAEQQTAAIAFRDTHPHPDAFDLALCKIAEPITGNGFGFKMVGEAIVRMRENGERWHMSLCVGYCTRLRQGEVPSSTARGTRRRERNLSVLRNHAGGSNG